MIYDEQSPLSPSSYSASIFEESRVAVTEDSLMRVQICEKAEELKDTVPEKKSTLNENQPEIKHQSLLQKNVNKKDPPNSHGHSDKKNLRVENGVTQRGRSASPQKPAHHYSEEHLEKTPSPLKNDPKRRPRDRSLSPRKRCQIDTRAGSGQDQYRKGRGRSSSPKRKQKIEGSKDLSNAEAKLLEGESRRVAGPTSDNAEQLPDGKERSGVISKNLKQCQLGKDRARSPEKKSKRMDEKSVASKKTSNTASRVVSESEKGKKTTTGETRPNKDKIVNVQISEKKLKQEPEERMALNKVDDHRGKELETTDKCRESGRFKPESSSPVKKAPITPGPWKVPSANKVTGTTGMAEKRL